MIPENREYTSAPLEEPGTVIGCGAVRYLTFSTAGDPAPRLGVAVGDRVLDVQSAGTRPGNSPATLLDLMSHVASQLAHVAQRQKLLYATIDLKPEEYQRYYLEFANSTLWPLFHYRLGLVEFDRRALDIYWDANERFARALLPLLKADDLIWVHDYHLIPIANELRQLVRQDIEFRGDEMQLGPRPQRAEDVEGRYVEAQRRMLGDAVRRVDAEVRARPAQEMRHARVGDHHALR